MKSNWNTTLLGNVMTLKRGYDLPSKSRISGEVPIFSSSGISGTNNMPMCSPPGVITGRYGTIGQVFFSSEPYWPLNTTLYVEDFKGNDPKFIYYFLKTVHWQQFSGKSAVPGINRNDIHRLEVVWPSMEEQKGIAAILTAFDDKIELNKKINDNLQRQAQALYYEWFIASLSEQSKEFQKVSLADLMDYAGGSQPPASEFISEAREGYIRFVQIRDYESDSHITYIPVSPKNKLCNERDIMIARYGAALGRICFGLNGAYNVALAKVFPKKPYYREFLRCYLSSREFYEGINNKGGRSAQAGFNQSDIRSFEVHIPIKEATICAFESVVTPLFEHRLHIIKENQVLALLRDALLPKLMSGEIEIGV